MLSLLMKKRSISNIPDQYGFSHTGHYQVNLFIVDQFFNLKNLFSALKKLKSDTCFLVREAFKKPCSLGNT